MNPTGHLVTLADGREVDSAADEWKHECAQRARHVANMRRLTVEQRRDYIANVQRKEGQLAGSRLRAAFLHDWEQRRAEREGLNP